jgi:hypothetical protein
MSTYDRFTESQKKTPRSLSYRGSHPQKRAASNDETMPAKQTTGSDETVLLRPKDLDLAFNQYPMDTSGIIRPTLHNAFLFRPLLATASASFFHSM